jgi:hypothetical protein
MVLLAREWIIGKKKCPFRTAAAIGFVMARYHECWCEAIMM